MELLANIKTPTIICMVVGVILSFFYPILSREERLILLVIYLNILADILANYLGSQAIDNGHEYNILSPIEKIITLVVYILVLENKKYRMIYQLGIAIIIGLGVLGFIFHMAPNDFHHHTYVFSGFVMAIFSYLFLRILALSRLRIPAVIFFFALANLVYYTLMVSAISAYPVALMVSTDFAQTILTTNDVAYALWSLIILSSVLWKRIKT